MCVEGCGMDSNSSEWKENWNSLQWIKNESNLNRLDLVQLSLTAYKYHKLSNSVNMLFRAEKQQGLELKPKARKARQVRTSSLPTITYSINI